MKQKNRQSILFCASEVYPFAKTGGLADVAHSLPRALSETYAVDVVLPLYASIKKEHFGISSLNKFYEINIAKRLYRVELFGCSYEGINYIFIYEPILCEREFLYGTPTAGYSDNALRFALFNYAIVELLKEKEYTLAHLNDWQSALVPLLLQDEPKIQTKTVLTIHNLAFQGLFAFEELESIGIDKRHFHMDALEFYGEINFLKAGIAFSDAITTVSTQYAKEILTPEFGCGLDGFLRKHKSKLRGILNGIDTEHFHPAHDRLIASTYTTLQGKAANKRYYLKEHKLRGINRPLFAFIGRFTEQKGIRLLREILGELAKLSCNIVILGEGEEALQAPIKELSTEHTNIRLYFEYSEVHAHSLYSGADFLLMPSLFEPCGLNQMIAMSYGVLPIVHSVGGLKESVHNFKRFAPESDKGYGILFKKPTKDAFLAAILEAVTLYETKKDYNSLKKHNMAVDFSWSKSAKKYIKLYRELQGN